MSKLLSQGGFGCVFYPGIKCNSNPNPSKNIVTKIQQDDFNARNESSIGEIIESIPNYKLYFLPVINSCPINVRKIDSSVISKCEIIKKDTNYIAMDIDYINTEDFTNLLYKLSSKRLLIILYQTYSYLLEGLKLMQDKEILHYDLKLDNMLFKKETKQPRIIDFGISIPMNKITRENMDQYFYVFAPEYYVWCIEINIINYLLHQKKNGDILTEEDAKLVIDMTINSNNIITSKSADVVSEYKEKAVDFYKTLIGKSKFEVIDNLKKHYKTWDNYSLSVLMMSIINKIFDRDEDKNGYIRGLERLMFKNMHPNPNNRLSIDETKSKLEDVLYEEGAIESYLTLSNHVKHDKKSISVQIKKEMNMLNLSLKKAAQH